MAHWATFHAAFRCGNPLQVFESDSNPTTFCLNLECCAESRRVKSPLLIVAAKKLRQKLSRRR